ncbi:hypothetical protein Ddye_030906 [Dipteronia dyeriana]|uniref:Pheophorbide a oxygenase domain-containing protein n=1 Tax=Dipteronia dyeriana TaxID=168575 RepID=A0AAD9THA1_9ROSI|nr:hypothetical protein Ddye_030906 [Dipteronia dyeriana]
MSKHRKPGFLRIVVCSSKIESTMDFDELGGSMPKYEVLAENLMDPAHVPYTHYGVIEIDQQPKVKVDGEGGKPLDFVVEQLDINGFFGKHLWDSARFVAPCAYYNYNHPMAFKSNGYAPPAAGTDHNTRNLPEQRRMVFFFFCIPVSPGNSRLIWGLAKNFRSWIDNITPRWIGHIAANLVVDSDLHLLLIEEHKIMDVGPANRHKPCFVPTKSDAFVICFRRWLNKYSDGQINWGGKFICGTLPPTPPREQLMDRYWSHVVNCRSCSSAYKSLKALEVILQVISIVSIGIVSASKQNVMSVTRENHRGLLYKQRRMVFFFFCIPVSPGNSRLIWGLAKNFRSWIDNITPRWIGHIAANLVVDSDLHLLLIEEHKIMDVGPANWHKPCFLPTKSDAFVVCFRRWLNKYSDRQINWGGKFISGTLPPTPPREQLMDRYWSHVVNCRSCSSAYKSLKALEVILQVISIVSIGIVSASKQNVMSVTRENHRGLNGRSLLYSFKMVGSFHLQKLPFS